MYPLLVSDGRPRTLVLAYPGCIFFEVMLATELVHEKLPVELASPDGAPVRNSNGMVVECAVPYGRVDPARYACVLVPGGNPDAIMEDPEPDRILAEATAGGAVVAGICAGVLVLAKAGVLRGRSATHNYTPEHAPPAIVAAAAPYWEGMTFDDGPVVVDGNVITAVPWAYVDFAIAVAVAVGACDEAQAARLARWYGGRPGAPGSLESR